MCGIAGFIGNFDPALLPVMNLAIAHRGPDDQDVYWDEKSRVGLAHRRLSIIDLSTAGRQPMWDVERRAVIVFNGEIYNYRELSAELKRDGYKFHSATDTEIILNLYLRDGVEALPKLNGIFAFALWDPVKRLLLVARDGMGVKPLYYFESPAGLAFASELKALVKLPQLSREVDPVALAHYLTYLYCPSPRTPLRHGKKLLPGSALLIGEDGRVQKNWTFHRHAYDEPIRTISEDEAKQGLLQHLTEAVRRQMVADVPVGAFLSGGLDSSALVTLARQFARDGQINCYTIGFKPGTREVDGFADDLPYAQRVAEKLGVKLDTIWVGSEMTNELDTMIYHLDEPLPDPAALNVMYICKLARQHGTKVLLSGAGGDDVFSGYRRHRALLLERYWAWLPGPVRQAMRAGGQSLPKGLPLARRIAKATQDADRDPAERLLGYFVWLQRGLVESVFTPELRAEVAGADLLEPLRGALAELPAGTPPLNQMLHLDSKYFLTDLNLNYTDKMSMATGVEVRVPFLDPDLMRFAASLPPDFKQHGPTGKWIFKRAMEPYLPHDVIYRPKSGFGAPLRSWMQNELRERVSEVLSPETLRRRGIFDPAAVARLVEQGRSGKIDASYPIFALMCMEIWFQLFLDRP